MKIGLDIDGVILDFERTMRCYAEVYDLLVLKKNGVQKENEFDYLKRYDWTPEERKNFINDYLVYVTLNKTALMPLVKEMLEFFEIEGYDYCFITARGLIKEETKLAIIEVFKRYGIPTDKIYFAVRDKVSKCRKLGIDLMIEDNPYTCRELVNNKVKTLYYRDKDNLVLENSDYLKEVSNVGDILRYIVNLKGYNSSVDIYKKILKKWFYV